MSFYKMNEEKIINQDSINKSMILKKHQDIVPFKKLLSVAIRKAGSVSLLAKELEVSSKSIYRWMNDEHINPTYLNMVNLLHYTDYKYKLLKSNLAVDNTAKLNLIMQLLKELPITKKDMAMKLNYSDDRLLYMKLNGERKFNSFEIKQLLELIQENI